MSIIWRCFLKCYSLADFAFFKVECKKQGKSYNTFKSTTTDSTDLIIKTNFQAKATYYLRTIQLSAKN